MGCLADLHAQHQHRSHQQPAEALHQIKAAAATRAETHRRPSRHRCRNAQAIATSPPDLFPRDAGLLKPAGQLQVAPITRVRRLHSDRYPGPPRFESPRQHRHAENADLGEPKAARIERGSESVVRATTITSSAWCLASRQESVSRKTQLPKFEWHGATLASIAIKGQ